MVSNIVRSLPFNAANIGSSRDGRTLLREVQLGVRLPPRGIFGGRNDGNYIETMKEDPEHFLGDIDDLFAPDAVRTGLMHLNNEAQGLLLFGRAGISQV